MKKVFIVHRWGENSKSDWLPWLAEELREKGLEVFTPDMPNTDEPEINAWVSKLDEIVGTPDEETFFVGHSIGCQTILRYLEKQNIKVGGAVFVAGWFDLENINDEREIARPWLETPIDLEKVKQVLPKSVLIISDNDPYGAFEENKNKFAELGAETVVMKDAGHITAEDGFDKLPEVLEQLIKLI